MAKSGRLELRDNIYGQYRSIFNHCDVFGHAKKSKSAKKNAKWGLLHRHSGHSRSSRVIEVGTNRKPVCDFLLVINSNYHPISYLSEISQLIVQILDTLRFWPTLWGLRTTYSVHLGLIGKRVVDFLLVIIELFSLGVTAEALRAKIDQTRSL